MQGIFLIILYVFSYNQSYPSNFIFEFDTLDELRKFDSSYIEDTRSSILKSIAHRLKTEEKNLMNVIAFKDKNNAAAGFTFEVGHKYKYYYETQELEEL